MDTNPVTPPGIASMVVPVTNIFSDSDISNSIKIISDLLCYVGVKKGFLFDNILVVVLGRGGVY